MDGTTDQSIVPQPVVRLTPAKAGRDSMAQVVLQCADLIAYWQDLGFTRLHLRGRRILEVRETTNEIDVLVRSAAAG